jgi:UDP-N-acetylmuramate dehydrogenase
VSQVLIEENKDLAPFTSWLVGGKAECYVAPQNIEQLKEAMLMARQNNWPISLLGGGTNVLVSDQGVKGLVIHSIHLNRTQILEQGDNLRIEAECGAPKSEVLKIFLKYRLQPAVFLAGLPGDMAGGVVMNAGVGHKVAPREFHEIVESFDVLSFDVEGELQEITYKQNDVRWEYRHSREWQPGVITRVRVRWPNKPDDQVLKDVREGNKRRKSTQPLSEPSCGSVFKNPTGDYAGRLIEACGLKGFSIGGAQVSEKHANFIVNKDNSTALDIHKVIEHVQKVVQEKYQMRLTNEVVYLGEWD